MQTVEVKQMPFQEKYERSLDFAELYESFVPVFVRQRLGDEAEVELRRRWREGTEPIAEGLPAEEKYERAYANFMAMAQVNFAFVREHMGEDAVSAYTEAAVEALKRQNAGLAKIMLDLIRAVSKPTAFRMMAKQSFYNLQWITPSVVTEFSAERAVMEVPSCKILDYPGSDDMCHIGCQRVFGQWIAEQFKADMSFVRQGKQCTCTLKPLD